MTEAIPITFPSKPEEYPEIPWSKLNDFLLWETFSSLRKRGILTIKDLEEIKKILANVHEDLLNNICHELVNCDVKIVEHRLGEVTAILLQYENYQPPKEGKIETCPGCFQVKELKTTCTLPGGKEIKNFCAPQCYKDFKAALELENKHYQKKEDQSDEESPSPPTEEQRCPNCDEIKPLAVASRFSDTSEFVFFCSEACQKKFAQYTEKTTTSTPAPPGVLVTRRNKGGLSAIKEEEEPNNKEVQCEFCHEKGDPRRYKTYHFRNEIKRLFCSKTCYIEFKDLEKLLETL